MTPITLPLNTNRLAYATLAFGLTFLLASLIAFAVSAPTYVIVLALVAGLGALLFPFSAAMMRLVMSAAQSSPPNALSISIYRVAGASMVLGLLGVTVSAVRSLDIVNLLVIGTAGFLAILAIELTLATRDGGNAEPGESGS